MATYRSTTLCLLLVVALGSAAPVQENSTSSCCWPKVFECKIGISIGQVSTVPAASQTMLVDGTMHGDWQTNKKIAVIEHVYNSAYSVDLKVIEDLEEKVMYIIQVAQKKCTKVPLAGFLSQDPCMSKTMTKVGTQKLGLGTESLDVNVFAVNNTEIFVKAYITQTQCLPVAQTFIAPILGSKQAQGQVYSDLSLTVKDPSVFTIPDYCEKDEPTLANQVVKDAVERHRARRSLWA